MKAFVLAACVILITRLCYSLFLLTFFKCKFCRAVLKVIFIRGKIFSGAKDRFLNHVKVRNYVLNVKKKLLTYL